MATKVIKPVVLDETMQQAVSKLGEIKDILNEKMFTPSVLIGEKAITANGTYEAKLEVENPADGYAKVVVDVEGGGGLTFDDVMGDTVPPVEVPTSWEIPTSITQITENDVRKGLLNANNKQNLETVVLAEGHPGLSYVGAYAFSGFSNLQDINVTIPGDTVETNAFYRTKLSNLFFSENIKYLHERCFSTLQSTSFASDKITNEEYRIGEGNPRFKFTANDTEDVYTHNRPDYEQETGGDWSFGVKGGKTEDDKENGDDGDTYYTIEYNGRWYNYEYLGEIEIGGRILYGYRRLDGYNKEIYTDQCHDNEYHGEFDDDVHYDQTGYYWINRKPQLYNSDGSEYNTEDKTIRYGFDSEPSLYDIDDNPYEGTSWYTIYDDGRYYIMHEGSYDGIAYGDEGGGDEDSEANQFADNTEISEYNLPNLVKVAISMFRNNPKVEEFRFDNVTHVAREAFCECRDMQRLTLKNCEFFDCNAIQNGCDSLNTIDFSLVTKVVKLRNMGDFPEHDTPITVKVPSALLNDFQNDDNWKELIGDESSLYEFNCDDKSVYVEKPPIHYGGGDDEWGYDYEEPLLNEDGSSYTDGEFIFTNEGRDYWYVKYMPWSQPAEYKEKRKARVILQGV